MLDNMKKVIDPLSRTITYQDEVRDIQDKAAAYKETIKTNPLDTQIQGNHYKEYKIQPVEFCQKNNIPWCESNVIKYVCRHKNKNGVEDLRKAMHYLELLIQLEYKDK